MEPLHLAVGLGPVTAGALEADPQSSSGLLECDRLGIGLGVVGQYRWIRTPWSAKKLAASSRNRAAVVPVSSGRIWLKATRERSSTAEGR